MPVPIASDSSLYIIHTSESFPLQEPPPPVPCIIGDIYPNVVPKESSLPEPVQPCDTIDNIDWDVYEQMAQAAAYVLNVRPSPQHVQIQQE